MAGRETEAEGRTLMTLHIGRAGRVADVAEAAVGLVVGGEEHLVVTPDAHGDDIVRVGGLRVKIEDKDQTAALK